MSYTPQIQNTISTLNSVTITPLTSGYTYQGTGEDVSKYGRAGISIWTPFGESTSGTLTIEVSRDGITYGGPTRTILDSASAEPHMWNIVEQYFRIKYVNDSISATTCQIQVQYSVNADIQLAHQLDEELNSSNEAIITRSVTVGQTPDGDYLNNKQDGLGFSTTSLLTSGQTYSSGVLSLIGYTQVQTDILSVGANGTTTIRFYEDSAGTVLLRTLTSTYTSGDGFKMLSAPAFTPYVKYDFECTSTGQTQFYFDTKFTTKAISGQIINLTDSISSGMVANLGRNLIVAQTEGGNYFQNISADGQGHIEVSLQNPRSAFGEVSMIEPRPVAQIDFVYGLNGQTTSISSTSGGTATTINSALVISTAANINSVSQVTSTRYMNYRPGQGAMGRFTAVFDTGTTNSLQYAGLGTASLNNGFFFGYSGTSFGITHKNSNSGTVFIPQSEWSEDVCSGVGGVTNKSGYNIDPQKGNVYQIKYQYLGFGNIYFYIESSLNGQFILVHQIKYPNTATVTSLQQPSLNLLWRVENTTNTSVLTMKAGSGSLFIEGERRLLGPKYGIDNNKSLAAGTSTSVLAIRNATTYNGVNNRAQLRIRTISLASDMSTTNSGIQVLQVHKNALLGGVPVFTPINGSTSDNGVTITNGGSIVSYDVAGTTITPITTGSTPSYVVFNTNCGRNGNVVVDVSELDIFMNPGDVLAFVIKTINGGTQQANVSINWVEDL